MAVTLLIIIGAAAGFIATRIMKVDTNVIVTVGVGVLGALIGGLLLRALVTVAAVAFGFIGAVLGAVFLIWFWQTYLGK
ncbi:GlsB/YeaQ/YmgE family stress response membrane protein [Maritimibacter sp. DP1N21-5]|uniref:GlsB/YeaQ/YmgE family stress response membrane protein n=1 Tax=Maritimibacter sp. DP1N21-5 TaxID=2836867 RepID=UPI001C48E89E|nr:GlsB/YeaQ/YmgE family stress response membrane protein [Maritimibacter sp. DP1N21-5]MBV7408466.1 GlsB/YeaQ/YmgE family stress response membrane protein [Maritimibacter sp. DP1N21-5]